MPRLSRFRRYALAALFTLLALTFGLLGQRRWGPGATYSFFLAAVMLSSWIGGLDAGIVATVLGTLAADYFLTAPLHALTFDLSHVIQLSAFMASAALISYLNESRRAAMTAVAGERAGLERRVTERTAELAAANATLRDEIDRRHRAQEMQEQLLRQLGERVKELTALHHTARLLGEEGCATELLGRVVEALPAAWQYPDITGVRIAVGEIDVRTPLFGVSPWLQRAPFTTPHCGSGVIEVVYRESRPEAGEGPFLAEERSLIESLAGMLQAYFVRLEAEAHRLSAARAEAARLQAQEANAAKDLFLATLSHELRSPLNVTLGWVQLLRAGDMDAAAVSRGLDVIERNVWLQGHLIDDLLDVSRIITGKLRIDRRHVDLGAVIQAAVEAARPAAEEKRVALTANITASLFLEADPLRLQQVVSNLLTNALKFTPVHGSVRIDTVRLAEAVQIRVQDTGIGMEAELLPRIFERFQQGESSSHAGQGGLGLGLAIVKYLVDQHGGQIEAASGGRGQGSTFTITLPVMTVGAAELAPVK